MEGFGKGGDRGPPAILSTADNVSRYWLMRAGAYGLAGVFPPAALSVPGRNRGGGARPGMERVTAAYCGREKGFGGPGYPQLTQPG